MSLFENLLMSSNTNISRRISSTRSGFSWARFSSRLRSVARSVTLSTSATLSTPPAFSKLWLITPAIRVLQALLHLVDDLRVGLPHRGDAADDRELPIRWQAGDDVGRLRRRQVREDQRDRLRVLVDDERQQVLAIDVLQKPKRHRLDRLPHVVERADGVFAERLFDERLGQVEPARAAGCAPGLTLANSLMTCSCSSPVTFVSLAISIETASTSLGASLPSSCAASSCGRLISSTAALRREPMRSWLRILEARRTAQVAHMRLSVRKSPPLERKLRHARTERIAGYSGFQSQTAT